MRISLRLSQNLQHALIKYISGYLIDCNLLPECSKYNLHKRIHHQNLFPAQQWRLDTTHTVGGGNFKWMGCVQIGQWVLKAGLNFRAYLESGIINMLCPLPHHTDHHCGFPLVSWIVFNPVNGLQEILYLTIAFNNLLEDGFRTGHQLWTPVKIAVLRMAGVVWPSTYHHSAPWNTNPPQGT